MEAAASSPGASGWWSARPRRAGAARRAQALRAHGRAVGHLLRAVEALEAHRGGTPTRLARALAEALRAPRLGEQASPSPPVDLRLVRLEVQAETEKQVLHREVAARDEVKASVWDESAQQVASEHEAHGATDVGAAAAASVPLAPTETFLQASGLWKWNSEAAPFAPAALAADRMDVDEHGAPGATTCTVAEPAAEAVGGDSGADVGARGRQLWEVQGLQQVASEPRVVASPEQEPPQLRPPTCHSPEPSLQVGDRVEIQGLQGSPGLNGRRGSIVSFVKATSRFEVRLEGEAATKGVKAANLRKVGVPKYYPHQGLSRWGSG